MAELKTRPTRASVEKFLNQVTDETRREDCFQIARMMQEITGSEPQMWGPSIVGFGSFNYKYASGQQADWPIAAFSPRKTDLTLYLLPGFAEQGDSTLTIAYRFLGERDKAWMLDRYNRLKGAQGDLRHLLVGNKDDGDDAPPPMVQVAMAGMSAPPKALTLAEVERQLQQSPEFKQYETLRDKWVEDWNKTYNYRQ